MGPIQNPRLCVYHEGAARVSDGHFLWQVFYSTVSEGVYCGPNDIEMYLEQLLPSSGYVVCPGIRKYPEEIRFTTKNLRQWGMPFNRKFSASCYQWHIPNNAHQQLDSIAFDCCKPCKQLLHDINQLALRATATTEEQKIGRTLPNSKYPLSKLSPASQKVRVKKITDERKSLMHRIKKMQPFDCQVNDKQNAELLHLVSEVGKNGSKVIDELIREGDKILGEDNILRDAWRQDVTERLEYERDQRKSGNTICMNFLHYSLVSDFA